MTLFLRLGFGVMRELANRLSRLEPSSRFGSRIEAQAMTLFLRLGFGTRRKLAPRLSRLEPSSRFGCRLRPGGGHTRQPGVAFLRGLARTLAC